jgi:hypothetical protein
MPKKPPPPPHDHLFEERTVVLGRHPLPELSGLLRAESTDLPYDESVDLDDADMESVSDASIDDIVLTDEELVATGGFRLGQPRATPESKGSRARHAPKTPPPPAKRSAPGKNAKSPPRAGARKPVSKGRATGKVSVAASFDGNAWAVEAQRLLESWLSELEDVELVRAHQVNQRESQERLWESHRARFGAKQDFSRALASAAVAEALRTVPQDRLVALELRAGTRYHLVWLDLTEKRLVAVLSDLKVS